MDYSEHRIGAEAAARIKEECFTGDPVSDHVHADLIIEETLRKLGMLRLADAYHNVRKAYEKWE
jgi:hypothetical protein